MAFDFSTDADFEGQLAWAREFVVEEVEPLDLLLPGLHYAPPTSEISKIIDPLKDQVTLVGPIMKPGSVTGYLIDKATSEKYGIRYVEELKDPEKAKLFADGGSKAKLIGPGVGWSDLVVARLVSVSLGDDDPLEHRRGRYLRPPGDA